jgi:type II secretory pathway pseudopilin PulG
MRMKRPGSRNGFAMLDLLVVVAVLALAVPLTLPVLWGPQEQARIEQCLANLGQLMQATSSFMDDYSEAPPVVIDGSGGVLAVCGWKYGGKTPSEYWKYEAGGAFYLPATERPLNVYLLGAQVQPDMVEGNQVLQRTPIPMLRCPSDRRSHQRGFLAGGVLPISAYDDVGTSYLYNLFGLENTSIDPWLDNGEGWLTLNRIAVRDALQHRPDSYVAFMEDPMDWGLYFGVRELGNHGEFAKHSAGYFDGHADYATRDTRYPCGVGWESIDRAWVRQPGQPDPPIFYMDHDKRCDPRD